MVAPRIAGKLPWSWIADNTRWMRKPRSYGDPAEAVEDLLDDYRQDVWRDIPVYVEIWIEKDAPAGVVIEETAP